MGNPFEEIEIPQQKQQNSFPFPYVLSPSAASPNPSLSQFIESIKADRSYLESLLLKSGAVLFRGFPVNSASDFNDVVEAFGYEDFPHTGGAALRTKVVGRVYTANESPLHLKIGFHHELSQLPVSPSKLFFFCEVVPVVGGETPIVPSHIVYERMKERYPDFVQKLEEQGVIYGKIIGDEDDPSNPVGRGWKSQFNTDDKKIAEERAAKIGVKMEWVENGAKICAGPVPAIKYSKSRNQKIWFNGILGVNYSKSKGDASGSDEEVTITFGDGKSLPREILSDCLFIEEEGVAFPWQKGDILLIDNMAVLHGRRPSNPPRRVLASLCR